MPDKFWPTCPTSTMSSTTSFVGTRPSHNPVPTGTWSSPLRVEEQTTMSSRRSGELTRLDVTNHLVDPLSNTALLHLLVHPRASHQPRLQRGYTSVRTTLGKTSRDSAGTRHTIHIPDRKTIPVIDSILGRDFRLSPRAATYEIARRDGQPLDSATAFTQFTAALPPTHTHGLASLMRDDARFQINSQLLTEFTTWLRNLTGSLPIRTGNWGAIRTTHSTPPEGPEALYDRIQITAMASKTDTADESLLKFWWRQWLLLAGADHVQLTAINLMRLARPDRWCQLQRPQGLHWKPWQRHFSHLLATLQGSLTIDVKGGIAAGNTGEIHLAHDLIALQ